MTIEDNPIPSGPHGQPSPARDIWTPLRLGILEQLRRSAPSLCELYEGAVILVHEKTPGYIRFVSHAVREIRNRLPEVITGIAPGKRVDYVNRVDDIAKLFREAGIGRAAGRVNDQQLPGGTALPSGSGVTISLPKRLYEKVEELISNHEKSRIKRKDSAQRLFEEFSPGNIGRSEAIRPVITQWINITESFVRMVHDNGKSDFEHDKGLFAKRFELFETTLGALLREFFSTMDGLDEILEDTNS